MTTLQTLQYWVHGSEVPVRAAPAVMLADHACPAQGASPALLGAALSLQRPVVCGSERLLLNHERHQDSWPPEEKNSVQGLR